MVVVGEHCFHSLAFLNSLTAVWPSDIVTLSYNDMFSLRPCQGRCYEYTLADVIDTHSSGIKLYLESALSVSLLSGMWLFNVLFLRRLSHSAY